MNPLRKKLSRKTVSNKRPLLAKLAVTGIITLLVITFMVPIIYFGSIALVKISVIEFLLTIMPQERIQGTNILAFGVDGTDVVQRADSIIVFHVDSNNNRLGVLSIPRDTRVYIPGHGLSKINHAYAYGGISLLKKTVANFMGVPIDYYMKINLSGVEKTIDKMGGLAIDIQKDLFYVDQAGDLYIDLKKGEQELSGKQAVQYLRFRHDKEGDFGRIRRQQKFLNSLANKVMNSGKIFELPYLIKALHSNIKTDISIKQMVGLSSQFGEIYKNGNINIETVPGAIILYKGVSYLRPDIVAMDRLIRETLFGFEKGNIKVKEKVKVTTIDSAASKEERRKLTIKEVNRIIQNTDTQKKPIKRLNSNLTIEVLNGCGIKGVARKIAKRIKEKGLKVSRYGNASSYEYQNTLIVDWKGEVNASIALAQELSIDPSKIIVYDRPEKPLDITIVVGHDWKGIGEE
jgi:polyisoprenyl-teichoic acid--peptidoglycan teichoic acid transferase